jgi:metallo-beta-lactamase family protein
MRISTTRAPCPCWSARGSADRSSTPGTEELLPILLLDAAHLQEDEAERANRYGYSKHKPALPLYTTADAEAALALTASRPYGQRFSVTPGVSAPFRRAGHILGSATVDLEIGGKPTRRVFSGDLGRWNRPILRDPERVPTADVLLIESTYGARELRIYGQSVAVRAHVVTLDGFSAHLPGLPVVGADADG